MQMVAAYLKHTKLEMWANAQGDGRRAEFNTAKTRNLLKLPGVPQTNKTISAASGSKFTILWGHVEQILLLNKFFSSCSYVP